MTGAEYTWQALEIIAENHDAPPEFGDPLHEVLARIVHQALWTYECKSVTYLSLPGVRRQRTLLRAGDPPMSASIPPRLLPPIETGDLTRASQTLGGLADTEFPQHVGLSIVEVETAPIGHASAHTQRLLATSQTPSETAEPTSRPLEDFLEAVTDRPHALAVVAERGDDGMTELAVRFVDFTPAQQIRTRDDLAAASTTEAVSVASVFDQYETMTNWELPQQNGWTQSTESRLPGPSKSLLRKQPSPDQPDRAITLSMECAMSTKEYAQLWPQRPADPLAPEYNELDVTGRLTPGVDRLPAFYPIRTQPLPASVWDQTPARAPVRITPLLPMRVPDSMTVAETDPTATASRQTVWTVDRTLEAFGSAAVRWCVTQGVTVEQSETSIPGAPFVACTPDGSRNLVSLLSADGLHRGNLIAVAWAAHQRADLDGLWVFAQSASLGEAAFHTLLQPFHISGSNATQLYRQTSALESERGVAVRPVNAGIEQWVVTPANALQCHDDGDIIADGSLTDPGTTFTSQLPAASRDDGIITVTHPTGAHAAQFGSQDAFHAAYRPVYRPACPPTLATGLETATVFHEDALSFREVRLTASWDKNGSPPRTQPAAVAFLDQYTIPATGTKIGYGTFEPEFLSYFRHQTDEPLSPSLQSTVQSELAESNLSTDRAWRYHPASGEM